MTINPTVHTPTAPSAQESRQGLHDPIQELLDSVTAAVESPPPVSHALHGASSPVAVEEPALEVTESAQASLARIVDRIRTQFRLLADLEIRRALERALDAIPEPLAPAPLPALQPETSIVYPREWHQDWGTNEAHSETTRPVDPKLFEGTVRLVVLASSNIQQVVRFVDELCQQPQLRILRMSGGPKHDGTEISIGLREPLAFVELLESMGHTVTAEDAGAHTSPATERSVIVRLAGA